MNTKNKLVWVLLAILALSMVVSIPLISIQVDAAATQKTYAIADAIPDRLGLGEQTLLKCGVTEALASQAYGWTGITITVVKPNGVTEKLGPFKTDSTGSTYTLYTPDQMGTYNITTDFPQQEMPVNTQAAERGTMIPKGTIMLASTATSSFTVTQDASQQYPGHALPTEYWSRPIDPQLREWYSISGNWVYRPDNSVALYNDDAPETAHVLWANQMTTGGLAGGLIADIPVASETGDAYEGKFPGSVILNGILYYQRTDTRREQYPAIIAVDLHTGEEWLFKNNTVLSFGQVFYYDSFNFDGVFTYIWSVSGSTGNQTWTAYDPFTGNQQMQITNVPSGTRVYGPHGELLIYQIDYRNGWMALWNSTDAGLQNAVIGTPDYGSWGNTAHGLSLQNKGLNGTNPRCYSWNVSIPKDLTQTSTKIYVNDRVVGIFVNQTKVRVYALNTANLNTGSTQATELYDQWWDAPSEWLAGTNTMSVTGASNWVTDPTYGDGVIAVWSKELRTHYGFSVTNGRYLWATESEHYLDSYGWGSMEHTWYFAYGKLYSVGVGGILYAYDLKTGDTAWTYTMNDPYGEPVTGNNWWGWIDLIADNKIYFGTLEHSAENPLPRGAPYIAVNASNGAEIWRVNGMFRETRWGGNGIIGDSIIATMDTYDQRVYAIGKGPTQTTISAPDLAVNSGDPVLITGSVTDISPGTATAELKMRFPNGVPAVSDASQSQWMLYVYKQFECPTNATGVDVILSVVDGNGNYRVIGTTTADSNGKYSYAWQPDISGKYTVYATFAGSAAYYSSTGQDAFIVKDAPATTAAPTALPQSAADTYFVPAVAVILVVLVVGIGMIMLALRKRP
ncbi:MAG TPA: hypothetical protein V6C97_35520 [Oculatellaceae cyanobacterium]